jgi:hypothetical protein
MLVRDRSAQSTIALANLLLHSGKTNHLRVTEVDVELSKVRDDAGQIGFEIEPSGGRLSV